MNIKFSTPTGILAAIFFISACAPADKRFRGAETLADSAEIEARTVSGTQIAWGASPTWINVRTFSEDGKTELTGIGCHLVGEGLEAEFTSPARIKVPQPKTEGLELDINCVSKEANSATETLRSFEVTTSKYTQSSPTAGLKQSDPLYLEKALALTLADAIKNPDGKEELKPTNTGRYTYRSSAFLLLK